MDYEIALSRITGVLDAETNKLPILVEIAGLDPTKDLIGLPFPRAFLANQNLSKFNFSECNLESAYLQDADLPEAHLESANLRGAHLESANLRGAHLEGANLKGAHLERAILRGANLEGAHLEGANLEGAHLEGANLKGAHLERAILRGANLEGAHLAEANLQDAVGLTQEQLALADKLSKMYQAGAKRTKALARTNRSASEGQASARRETINELEERPANMSATFGPDQATALATRKGKAVAETAASEIGASLDPRFTFENFVVGKPNELAYAAARRVAEAKRVPFNPLFLYGGIGLGKTHLMHAVAWQIRRQYPQRTVAYLSAEKFMYRFIRALREQSTVDFKEQFRSVNVLMIDDLQFISGRESTQEEFFHVFNTLVDQGRQIVLSADKSPSDLEGMQERLKSRLNCGLVADIHATTYELRLGILHSKAEQLGIEVPQKVIGFLAHRITSNVRELEGALNRVVAHAQLIRRPITLDTTQEVLRDSV